MNCAITATEVVVQVRKTIASPQLLILLVSFLLSIGMIEGIFRALQGFYPELSVDVIAADQQVLRNLDRKRAYIPMKKMIEQAFLDLRVDPKLFGSEYTRVLFLGDSFTQGAGIKDWRNRFSNVLESRINDEAQRAESPQRLDIFNAGIGGTNPIHWIGYFERIAPVYRPDVVFAIFFLRDGALVPTSVVENKAEIKPIRAKYRSMPAYEWSATLRYVYNKLAWKEYGEQYKQKITSAYVGTRKETATWRKRRQSLLRIADECEAKGIAFHLVIFPMLLDLDDYAFTEVEDEISRFAQTHNIPVFSLTPGFLGERDSTLWLSATNQHPNIKGNRIAADTLDPYLRDAIARAHERLPSRH